MSFDFYVGAVMDGTVAGPDADDVDGFVLGANYMAGPLSLSAGYWNFSDNYAGSTDDAQNILLGGSYAFGPLTLGLAYENYDDGDLESDLYGISAVYEAGAAAPYVQYSQLEADGYEDADEWALGLNYSLGKKAGVGVEYSSVDWGDDDAQDQFNVSYYVKF
jgi:predicted porin